MWDLVACRILSHTDVPVMKWSLFGIQMKQQIPLASMLDRLNGPLRCYVLSSLTRYIEYPGVH